MADGDARIVYDFHRMRMPLHKPVDAVFCLCSLDTRVADYAADLFLAGYGEHLIFSGGSGVLTQDRFNQPEAEVFAARARDRGVPNGRILIEPASTNTGENVRFTWALLQRLQLSLKSFILVQKPYMERRTFATFKKQWPDPAADIAVSSPNLEWDEYPNEENPRDLATNIMVGDLFRIRDYPEKGYQIYQHIPDHVLKAARRLISAGYDKHLPPECTV